MLGGTVGRVYKRNGTLGKVGKEEGRRCDREVSEPLADLVDWLPQSLHYTAGAPNCGAKEKTGRSGRDDR